MNSLLFHLIVIPGIFILGRLSRSVKVATIRVKPRKARSLER
jgi:hypothetical protein